MGEAERPPGAHRGFLLLLGLRVAKEAGLGSLRGVGWGGVLAVIGGVGVGGLRKKKGAVVQRVVGGAGRARFLDRQKSVRGGQTCNSFPRHKNRHL